MGCTGDLGDLTEPKVGPRACVVKGYIYLSIYIYIYIYQLWNFCDLICIFYCVPVHFNSLHIILMLMNMGGISWLFAISVCYCVCGDNLNAYTESYSHINVWIISLVVYFSSFTSIIRMISLPLRLCWIMYLSISFHALVHIWDCDSLFSILIIFYNLTILVDTIKENL